MLEQVLRYLRNWFVCPNGIQIGSYTIEGGGFAPPFLLPGQYYRIVGSTLNDGVYLHPADLIDETFDGAVWALAVPKAVLNLADEITIWQAQNGAAAIGPYQSESFGGYTYSRAVDTETGGAMTWQSAFADRLNPWRKL